jgi:hypothetical protein
MSNRNNDNDFNFDDDDDLFGDRNTVDDFDFGDDDSDFPSPLADEFALDDDTPDFDEEQEERGPNRTFVFLAILMILMFVIGLGAVLFLATRPTGPNDAELTGTFVVQFNETQRAYLEQTQTQSALDRDATSTAAFAAVELTNQALLTQQADVAAASLLTQTAAAQELFNALTQTALAQPTATREPTITPTPEEQFVVPEATPAPPELALVDAWSTQVAFVTQQAAFDQEVFATQAAYATQIGEGGQNPEAEQQISQIIQSTAAALSTQASSVQIAIIAVDNALATAAAENPDFATQFAEIAPIGQATQTALADFALLPTASPTPIASGADVDGKRNLLLRFPLNARSIFDPNQDQPAQIQPTPPAFSTAAAVATQSALSTRQALIDRLLGTPEATPTTSLDAVNQTATAIANAFISATQTAAAAGAVPTTPTTTFGTIVPTPQALPDTGLFDEIGGGDNIGLLALMVVGLVGVVFISRRLRTTPASKDAIDSSQ